MPRRVTYRRVRAELYSKENAVMQSVSIDRNEQHRLEMTARKTLEDLWFCRYKGGSKASHAYL